MEFALLHEDTQWVFDEGHLMGAARAAGAASGANPIVIILPCHRVIGANGSLVGYGDGLNRKADAARVRAGGRGGGDSAGLPDNEAGPRGPERCIPTVR